MSLNAYQQHAMEDTLPKSAWVARLQSFPALMALCIQCLSALIFGVSLIALKYLLSQYNGMTLAVPLGLLCLFQGLLSSFCSHQLGMARWWSWIHLGFPLMVWFMLAFSIPQEIYLIGFLVTASIYWTTFRTQVPYYPSRLSVWQTVSNLTHQYQAHYGASIRVMEIGSGLGGFARYIANTHPEAKVEGVEVAPLPWLVSQIAKYLHRSSAQFHLTNYNKLQFADYDIVFAYLSPAAMPALWEKAQQEMQKGHLLISLEFPILGVKPTQHIPANSQSPDLYIYQH